MDYINYLTQISKVHLGKYRIIYAPFNLAIILINVEKDYTHEQKLYHYINAISNVAVDVKSY